MDELIQDESVKHDPLVSCKELIPAAWDVIIPVILAVLFFVILMFHGCLANATEIYKGKFVDAIIGESEAGSYEGKLWVACTIRNRGNLRGVYGVNSPRVRQRLYSSKIFVQAVKAYEESAKQDITGGCKFWFSDADLKQAKVKKIIRAEKLVKVKRVAGNNFYKRGKI